jgi:hypothetical protein
MHARARRITGAGVTLMKRTLTTIAAVIALPLFAEEQAKTAAAAQPAKPQPAAATVVTAPAPVRVESPLVAAARRTNRLGKKPANVITNETLVKAGTGSGRVTTTAAQEPIKLPEPSTPRGGAAEIEARRRLEEHRKAAAVKAQKEKEEAERKRKAMEAAIGAAEEGLFYSGEGVDSSAGRNEQSQKPPQF